MPDTSTTYALIVALGNYPDPHLQLKTARNDGEAFYDLLCDEQIGNLPHDNVWFRFDEHATYSNIVRDLNELADEVVKTPGATVIFYFSGHGEYRRIGDDKGSYLLPHDVDTNDLAHTAFSRRYLENAFNAIFVAGAGRLVVFLDCCYAGQVANFDLTGLGQRDDLAIFAACQPYELALARDHAEGHGIFTECLLEALAGAAATKSDRYISLFQVGLYLDQHVKARAASGDHIQQPVTRLTSKSNQNFELFPNAKYEDASSNRPQPALGNAQASAVTEPHGELARAWRPPTTEGLLPRNQEVADFSQRWQQRGIAAAAITGLGGQGKTSFASLYATTWLGRVYWRTVASSGAEIVATLLNKLGVGFDRNESPRSRQLAAILVNALQERDEAWLLVVDNIEPTHLDTKGYLADGELKTLLELACKDGLGRSRMLLTTRVMPQSIGLNKPLHYLLDGLEPPAGVRLMRTILEREREVQDESLLLRVAGKDYTKGNPYALVLLANLINDRANGQPDRFLGKLLTDSRIWNNAVDSLLVKLWEQLPNQEKEVAKYTAIFNRPVEIEVLRGMLGKLPRPLTMNAAALHGLVRRELAELDSHDRYDLHPLLRRHAYKKHVNAAIYHLAAAR